MKWPYLPLSRGDVLGIAFVVAVLGIVAAGFAIYPRNPFQMNNAGFGADWDCTNPGHGEPVCVKRIGTGR
jgi:hypothetical protein